jgi:outer membrane protein assembly factor BamE
MIDHIATPYPMFDLQRVCVRLPLLLLAGSGLVACGSFDSASNNLASVVTPYKIDIVQGNFVSKEQVTALKPGMSRLQVRAILGTPLLASIFHENRWDYVFTFKRQGLEPQARKVTVYFNGDAMERVEADPLPTEAEFVASLDSGRVVPTVPVLELSEEALKQLPANPRKTESKALPPVPASYPPLEPAGQ